MATRGARLLAAILDGIIGDVLIYVPFVIGLYFTRDIPALQDAGRLSPQFVLALLASMSLALLAALVGALVWIAITVVLVKRNGQTLGKKLLGIKVVRSDGSRASLGRIFWLRNVVTLIIGMIPLLGIFFVLADILMIFGEARRCIHDRIADTIVVRA